MPSTSIEYALWASRGAGTNCFDAFEERVRALAAGRPGQRVCDLGGGAAPMLDRSLIDEHDLGYVVFDVSADELAKAPEGYETAVADLTDAEPPVRESFDLAFSKTLAEHVSDPSRFHQNVHRMLRPGGVAIHFFPTFYALPFVVNRLLPESVSARILRAIQSGREEEGAHGKFPALYRWCRGPTARQLARLEGVGFGVLRYTGYFGHGYYQRVAPLQALEERWSAFLTAHPIAALTSYACVELQKPA
jgi:SAM-dependent methyltransferase